MATTDKMSCTLCGKAHSEELPLICYPSAEDPPRTICICPRCFAEAVEILNGEIGEDWRQRAARS